MAQSGNSAKTSAKTARAGRATGGRRGCGLGILLLFLMVPAALAAWSWWTLRSPYKGYEGADRLVTIAPGSGTGQILQTLQHDGVIADAKLARVYLVFKGEPKIQAGQYRFHGPLTTAQALRMLIKGQIVARTLTIVEGRKMADGTNLFFGLHTKFAELA